MFKRELLGITAVVCCFSCTEPVQYVHRDLTIWNRYVSNGYDNYDDEIEINLRLESLGWLWYYGPGDRVKIYSNAKHTWSFELPENLDSVFVHARFFYSKDITIQIVSADTTIRMDSEKNFKFWNCGDSTVTEHPFPACLRGVESL